MEYSLIAVFSIGLISTLHCLGMCGGIIGALSLSLPSEVQQQRWRLLPFVLAYNIGRVLSYALAGALAASVGQTLFTSISPSYGHLILQWTAALTMLGIGLYLAGWFPQMARIEKIGRPLWQHLEPIGQRLLPVRHPAQALVFGMIWGWLPCGLVYAALIYAASAGSAMNGAIFMAAFGLGTLPTVIGAGILTGLMGRLARKPGLRRGAGITVVIIALLSVLPIQNQHTEHNTHLQKLHQHN